MAAGFGRSHNTNDNPLKNRKSPKAPENILTARLKWLAADYRTRLCSPVPPVPSVPPVPPVIVVQNSVFSINWRARRAFSKQTTLGERNQR